MFRKLPGKKKIQDINQENQHGITPLHLFTKSRMVIGQKEAIILKSIVIAQENMMERVNGQNMRMIHLDPLPRIDIMPG